MAAMLLSGSIASAQNIDPTIITGINAINPSLTAFKNLLFALQ